MTAADPRRSRPSPPSPPSLPSSPSEPSWPFPPAQPLAPAALPRPAEPAPAVRGVRERALGWFGSARNIAGCGCALVGAAISAAGVVEWPFWPPVVAGLYGIGALVAPPPHPLPPGVGPGADELRATLAAQRRMLAERVPADIVAAADEVGEALRQVLDSPHLLRPGSPEAFVIERTVADYLPTALEAYLALPRTYAETHVLADGRTPRTVLLDALCLLTEGVRDATRAAAAGDTDRLLAHSRFLADRFGPSGLALPPTPPPSTPAPVAPPPSPPAPPTPTPPRQ